MIHISPTLRVNAFTHHIHLKWLHFLTILHCHHYIVVVRKYYIYIVDIYRYTYIFCHLLQFVLFHPKKKIYSTYSSPTSINEYCANFFQLQSLIWIAMSIIAILAYYCVFNFRGMSASLGTLTELTLFRMYFHGTVYSHTFDFVCIHFYLNILHLWLLLFFLFFLFIFLIYYFRNCIYAIWMKEETWK